MHFRPLRMETARGIPGKRVQAARRHLNVAGARRASHVGGLEPDGSAVELILREGFSEEYCAGNLERVVNRMPGTLIAEMLLSGEISVGQKIRLVAKGGKIECSLHSSP